MDPKSRICERCHIEHQGLDFPLVDWGPRGQTSFDHSQTGWELRQAHRELKCEGCHELRRLADSEIRTLAAQQPNRRTYLGLAKRCTTCHFDEHRGQEGADCERCHDTTHWKPAPSFDHSRSSFPLRGAHVPVDCSKCHDALTGPPQRGFPEPRAETYLHLKGLAFGHCTDCHTDTHRGRFGRDCTRCHDESAWNAIQAPRIRERSFHDSTRYPLRGAHALADCRGCHGPHGRLAAKFRGLDFDRCSRCHSDGHAGQLGGDFECDRCHTIDAFLPVRFGALEHQAARYALEGAHRLVACVDCHPPKRALQEEATRLIEVRLRKQGRPIRVSGAVLRFDATTEACDRCHTDPHRGQFERACSECHTVSSFQDHRFDHERDSSFPLTGAHTSAPCVRCHPIESGTRRYRGVPHACAACHIDAHVGQFVGRYPEPSGGTEGYRVDCGQCHRTTEFVPSTFDHEDAHLTTYAREGRHREVPCRACHPEVELPDGRPTLRYTPSPRRCDACHVDPHEGSMRRYLASTASVTSERNPGDCAACHTPKGWKDARFDHAGTGVALAGSHAELRCHRCHEDDLGTPVPRTCDGCHRDPHGRSLGLQCASCHDERSWRSRFDPFAHRRTNFPLVGRHAVIPCEECHLENWQKGFSRAPLGCVDCHLADYQRTTATLDHAGAGFDLACQRCHSPWRFDRARLPGHEICFQIGAGEHSGIGCRDCHSSLAGVRIDGTCSSRTAACSSCHEHSCDRVQRSHDEVPGFQCKDRKCYECHRFAAD